MLFRLLVFVIICLSSSTMYAQCNCDAANTVTVPSTAPISYTSDGQTICITGEGTFDGTIQYNRFNNAVLCIGSGVIVGNNQRSFNPGTLGAGAKIINYGLWNRDLGGTILENVDFENRGIVNTNGFSLNALNVFDNYSTLNVINGGTLNMNDQSTLRVNTGSKVDVSGSFRMPSAGTVELSGLLNIAGNLLVQGQARILALPPGCAGLTVGGLEFKITSGGTVGIAPNRVYTNRPPTESNGSTFLTVNSDNNAPNLGNVSNPLPQAVCEGNAATFSVNYTGTAGVIYQWQVNSGNGWVNVFNSPVYSGANTRQLTINPVNTTLNGNLYRAEVTLCPRFYDTQAATLTVYPKPNLDLGKSSDTVCSNVAEPLVVTGNWSQVVWYKVPAGFTQPAQGSRLVNATVSGLYAVRVTSADGRGCTQQDSVNITFASAPLEFSLPKDTSLVCYGQTKPIVVSGTYNSIVWQGPAGITIPAGTGNFSPDSSGRYIVTVGTSFGCFKSDTVIVRINKDQPPLQLGADSRTICFNSPDPIVITGNFSTIRWATPTSVVVPDQTRRVDPVVSGLYVVNVVDFYGCQSRDQVNVSFSPRIDIGLNGKDTLACAFANNYIITAPSGFTAYRWEVPSPGIQDNVYTYRPRASGRYKVFVTNGTCVSSDSVNVTFDKDSADLGLPKYTVCGNFDNFSITISPDVFAQIDWYNNVGVTIPQNTKSYTPTKLGTYKVVATKANGCSSSDSTIINFVDTIKVDLGGDSALSCESRRVVLNPVQGDFNYIWTAPAGVTIPNGTTSFTPQVTGLYKVVISNAQFGQCAGSDSIFVTYPDTIQLNFSGDSAVSCFGAGFRLCAGAGYPSYVWSPASQVPSSTRECFAPAATGRYTLTVTDRFGCRKSDSIYVRHYNEINIGLNGADTATCFPYTNSYIIRLPTGNYTYDWAPKVTADSVYRPVFDGDSLKKFKVKVTNKDGCFATDSVTVHFVPEIKFPGIVGGDTTACQYAKFTIRAGGGFARYEWVNNVAGEKDSVFVPTSTGDYYVTVYAARGGCKKTSDTSNVNFAPDKALSIEGPDIICSSDSVLLLATSGFDRYEWMGDASFSDSFFLPAFPQISGGSVERRITVRGIYEKICSRTAERNITFIKKEDFNLGDDVTVCPGTPVTMDPGPGYINYAWVEADAPGLILSNKQVLTVTKPGTYTVTLTSRCGRDEALKTILNWKLPDASISYTKSSDPNLVNSGRNFSICYTDSATLFLTESPGVSYIWKDKTGKVISNRPTISINDEATIYTTVISSNNCPNQDSIIITANGDCFMIPNLFTPNNDNKNEKFFIKGIKKNTWQLKIYNRWGQQVYFSKGYNNEWAGDDLSDGIYFYELQHPDNKQFYKGWVEMLDKTQ